MEKFQLIPNETLIGSGPIAIYLEKGLHKRPFQGKIYIFIYGLSGKETARLA